MVVAHVGPVPVEEILAAGPGVLSAVLLVLHRILLRRGDRS